MLEHKTLKETAAECEMSVSTAFSWRHKILDAVSDLAENVFLTATESPNDLILSRNFQAASAPHYCLIIELWITL